MSHAFLRFATATSILALCSQASLAQSPIPRPTPVAGSIVAAKSGEELRFVREGDWRNAVLQQELVGGDTVRTNSIGNLAILFADQTQIRVGRNSTLVVNEIASSQGNTKLELQAGNVWARAARGGSGVDIKTPAAVAAIRGTDWSLAVDGSGKTSLVVLEGVVELSNAQGSVTVRQGEGAVAAIGQAPTKFVLVNSNDREQMLFHLTLRDAFNWLPATPLPGPALRAERARIEAVPASARRAEDWLSFAEAALALDGRAAAAQALAEARRRPLSKAQRARADLVDGLLAGSQRRWSEAAALFARAERGLDARRRTTAVYGRYVAASLADPKRVQPRPNLGSADANGAVADAFVAGFQKNLEAAAEVAKQAEKRFPADARLAVFSAQMAFALDRRDEMRAAIARAEAIDPNDPDVLLTKAFIKAGIDKTLDPALADLRQAVAIAPGNAQVWNAIGLIESERDATLEAEAALRRAIAEDPESPVSYGNLAILLLDQNRVDEAGVLIEKAFAVDPGYHVAHTARGRYLLQTGDMAGALKEMLAGSAANPAYSDALLGTAAAHYQNGDVELAEQALDNADRLDPNAPIVSIVRTAIALDQYRADDAILASREAVKRARARGGDYAGLAVNRQSGSYPVEAYRFIGLDEWARYYGDRTFDAFTASSYFDQAAARRPRVLAERPTIEAVEGGDSDVTAFNLVLQGLFFDPLAVSGRIGRLDFFRRPFLDTEVGGSLISRGDRLGWQADATVQGYANNPVPTSFSLTAGRVRADGEQTTDQETSSSASVFVGMAPSAADRFLIFGTATEAQPGLARVLTPSILSEDKQDSVNLQGGAGWSHTFGHRNVLTAAIYGSRGDVRQRERDAEVDQGIFADFLRLSRSRVDAGVLALNHTIGVGDVTLRYGVEGQAGHTSLSRFQSLYVENLVTGESGVSEVFDKTKNSFRSGRIYADAFWRPSDRFEAQAGVQGTSFDSQATDAEGSVEPRIGAGLSLFEGQWLRVAYRRDTDLPLVFTLAPVTTVGLVPNDLPGDLGGRTDTFIARWDAEWTPRFFTAVEYQRQKAGDLSIPIANTLDDFEISEGSIDRISASANLWLGYGIGVFGTVGATASEIDSGPGRGLDIPYVPDRFARAGITFVHPSRLKLTVAQTYVGSRTGNLAGTLLDDYWTTDAALTWETPDRRLLFGLTALNLLDTNYDLAPNLPGPGRTIAASIRARF